MTTSPSPQRWAFDLTHLLNAAMGLPPKPPRYPLLPWQSTQPKSLNNCSPLRWSAALIALAASKSGKANRDTVFIFIFSASRAMDIKESGSA